MRVVGYCRVSTSEQAASGLGLEAQETRSPAMRAPRLARSSDVRRRRRVSGKTSSGPASPARCRRSPTTAPTAWSSPSSTGSPRSVIDFGALLEWFREDAAPRSSLLDLSVDTLDRRRASSWPTCSPRVAQWERSRHRRAHPRRARASCARRTADRPASGRRPPGPRRPDRPHAQRARDVAAGDRRQAQPRRRPDHPRRNDVAEVRVHAVADGYTRRPARRKPAELPTSKRPRTGH